MTGHLRTAAPGIDLACLVVFVLIGGNQHGISGGIGWFLGVLWPLALGWFVAVIVTRLYTNGSRPWLRLVGTWALGMTIALLLRGLVLGRQPASTFTLVLFGFVAFETFGWRALALLFRRVAPARV
jgi:hypothetical protein